MKIDHLTPNAFTGYRGGFSRQETEIPEGWKNIQSDVSH